LAQPRYAHEIIERLKIEINRALLTQDQDAICRPERMVLAGSHTDFGNVHQSRNRKGEKLVEQRTSSRIRRAVRPVARKSQRNAMKLPRRDF